MNFYRKVIIVSAAILLMGIGTLLGYLFAHSSMNNSQNPMLYRYISLSEFSRFLFIVKGENFDDIKREGETLFTVGSRLPSGWIDQLENWKQGGPSTTNTYLFYDAREEGESRKVMLIVDPTWGEVVDFNVDSLRLIP